MKRNRIEESLEDSTDSPDLSAPSPWLEPLVDETRGHATYTPTKWTTKRAKDATNHKFGLISLYNFKGGVGKTTTTFAIAWALAASAGRRILMVDCDPQMNLTHAALQYEAALGNLQGDIGTLVRGPDDNLPSNLYEGLSVLVTGSAETLQPVQAVRIPIRAQGNGALYLLPGALKLAKYDANLAVAYERALPSSLDNQIGGVYRLLQMTAMLYNCDLVIADLSPAMGPLNQTLLLSSNVFYVPCAPDHYSLMAVTTLREEMPQWIAAYQAFRDKVRPKPEERYTGPYHKPPEHKVKFGGSLLVRFLYGANYQIVAEAIRHWTTQVENGIQALANELHRLDHSFPVAELLNLRVPEYSTLAQISHRQSMPVAFLTDEDLKIQKNHNGQSKWVRVGRFQEMTALRDYNRDLLSTFIDRVRFHLPDFFR